MSGVKNWLGDIIYWTGEYYNFDSDEYIKNPNNNQITIFKFRNGKNKTIKLKREEARELASLLGMLVK